MDTDVQKAFEQSLDELGLAGLFDSDSPAPETNEETEPDDSLLEAEEESDEPADEDDAPEDDDEPDDVPYIDIVENAKLKLPDGTVVDAKSAVLMQKDYTRKTQEIAEQRKELDAARRELDGAAQEVQAAYENMRGWYEQRAAQPASWIAEIASQSADATATVAQALYTMAQNGLLDPKFVETFGIDAGEVAKVAEGSQVKNELDELKKWRYQQEVQAQQQAAVRNRAVEYEREWEHIKQSKGMEFQSRVQELEVKKELLQFAIQNNLTRSLVDAYDLMTVRKPRVSSQPGPDPEVAAKKRASRAVTPKSANAGTAKQKKVMSTREAALEAFGAIAGA
jgi:hypothetical protein